MQCELKLKKSILTMSGQYQLHELIVDSLSKSSLEFQASQYAQISST
jgi:hypothetical protein